MKLLIFRHGIAQDHSLGVADHLRELTGQGQTLTSQAATGLTKVIDQVDLILTSPLLRAVQTAQILGHVYDHEPQILQSLAQGPAQAIAKSLCDYQEQTILLVGHEPTLSELIELLCLGQLADAVRLKKAGCACIDRVPIQAKTFIGSGQLQWLATPKMLRRLG